MEFTYHSMFSSLDAAKAGTLEELREVVDQALSLVDLHMRNMVDQLKEKVHVYPYDPSLAANVEEVAGSKEYDIFVYPSSGVTIVKQLRGGTIQ